MKNDDIKKYLVQLRDILNQMLTHPKEMNVQKVQEEIIGSKNEIHVYLIPLILDPGYEDLMTQGEDSNEESRTGEDELVEEEDLKYEITPFDKAFLKKWGIEF